MGVRPQRMVFDILRGIPVTAAFLLFATASPSFAAQTLTYTYDALGRLASVSYDDTIKTVYLYDASGNLLQAVTGPNPTGVPGEGGPPRTFGLSLGSPNPARDGARITYQLPRASRVTLSIYDTAGRRLRVLVNADAPAGVHAARWDQRDDMGRPVRSGLYFVRMEAERFTATRKLVVLR